MTVMDVSALSQLVSNSLQAGQLSGIGQNQTDGTTQAFSDILGQMIDNVNTTDSAYQADIVKTAEGELDNPHQLLIDSTKASVALQLMTGVRNNALQAYNDIIRMSV